MLGLLGGIVSGVGSLVQGWMGSETSAKNTEANIAMQHETNQINIAEAQKNRDFQQQMSSTAYQRSSQDMQQAGLNPMMMFGSGAAASSPGGAQGHAVAPRSELKPLEIGKAVDSMVNTAISVKTLDKMTEEIANLQANEARTKAETLLTHQREQTESSEKRRRFHEANIAGYSESGARVSAKEAQAKEKMPSWLFDMLNQVGYGSEKAGKFSDIIAQITNSALGVKRYKWDTAPRRSTTQESGTTESGKWYDRFRDSKEWRE